MNGATAGPSVMSSGAGAMPHPDNEDRVFVFWRPDHIGGVAKAPELAGEPAAAD